MKTPLATQRISRAPARFVRRDPRVGPSAGSADPKSQCLRFLLNAAGPCGSWVHRLLPGRSSVPVRACSSLPVDRSLDWPSGKWPCAPAPPIVERPRRWVRPPGSASSSAGFPDPGRGGFAAGSAGIGLVLFFTPIFSSARVCSMICCAYCSVICWYLW